MVFSRCLCKMEVANFAGPSTDKDIRGPLGVKYDDEDHILTVILAVPGIKKPWFFGLWGKNTLVDIKFEDSSLRVYLEISKSGKSKSSKSPDKCLFIVRQLPANICPDDCYFRLKDNQCIIYLKKEDTGSWQNMLDANGLEQFIEPEIDVQGKISPKSNSPKSSGSESKKVRPVTKKQFSLEDNCPPKKNSPEELKLSMTPSL